MIQFELRDDVDDLPYAKVYDTQRQAAEAAQKKADKLGHDIEVWSVSPTHGERYCGRVEPRGRAW